MFMGNVFCFAKFGKMEFLAIEWLRISLECLCHESDRAWALLDDGVSWAILWVYISFV